MPAQPLPGGGLPGRPWLLTNSHSEEIKMKKKWIWIAVLFLFALVMAACSSGSPGTVNVNETSYKIEPANDSAPAGSVTFHVINKATDMAHDLKVIKSDLDAAKLPTDSAGNVDMTQVSLVGGTDTIQPNGNADVTLNLQAGHYVLICSIPGHYAQGMYANFTVK
jgi:uncharacterized cupredoxin-like copper-binding protein